jgi:hypothetical protein
MLTGTRPGDHRSRPDLASREAVTWRVDSDARISHVPVGQPDASPRQRRGYAMRPNPLFYDSNPWSLVW